MVAFGQSAVISAVALLGLVQYCPAPPVAAIIGWSAVAGAVTAGTAAGIAVGHDKRRRIGKSSGKALRQDANQQAWDDCDSQVPGAAVHVSFPQPGSLLVEGVPPACMTLAAVWTGDYGVGTPVPMGADSMLLTNVSDEDIQLIKEALDVRVKA